jgi:Leucine rich repeat/F-box-like
MLNNKQITNLPKDVLIYILSFLSDIKDIENVQLVSKYFHQIATDNALWGYLKDRDLSKYLPRCVKHLPSKNELSTREKYIHLFKIVFAKQEEEIEILNKVTTKRISQNYFDPEDDGFTLEEYLPISFYKKIASIMCRHYLKKIISNNSDGLTLGDLVKLFVWREIALDEANILIVTGAIEKYKNENAAILSINLSLLLSRLPNEAAEKLLEVGTELEVLSLEKCNLFVLPEKIFELPSLKKLDLSDNNFLDISENIQKLQSLRNLYLGSNQLERLPLGLFELSELKTLSIGNFAFSGLKCRCCDRIGKKTTGNSFQKLPSGFDKLKSLKVLNIRSIGLTEIPKELGKLNKLEMIDASHNAINDIPNEILTLPNIQDNALWLFGNPVINWIPLMKIQGKINKTIQLNQVSADFYYCKTAGKVLGFTQNLMKQKVIDLRNYTWMWASANPKKALTLSLPVALTLLYGLVSIVMQDENLHEQRQPFSL